MTTTTSGRDLARRALAAWVEMLGQVPWDWYCTWTFASVTGPTVATRRLRRWFRQVEESAGNEITYFYGLEQGADRVHAHGLVAGVPDLLIRPHFERWLEENGRAKIVPFKPEGKAVRYCVKYILKDGDYDFSPSLKAFLDHSVLVQRRAFRPGQLRPLQAAVRRARNLVECPASLQRLPAREPAVMGWPWRKSRRQSGCSKRVIRCPGCDGPLPCHACTVAAVEREQRPAEFPPWRRVS